MHRDEKLQVDDKVLEAQFTIRFGGELIDMNNKLMSREDYIQLQQERLTVSENQSTMSAE